MKFAFATATALGMLMASGVVYASGSNQTFLTQTGNSQAATITQSGGSNNKVGTSGSPFVQENGAGSYGHNVLVLDQNTASTGSGNSAAGYQSGALNDGKIDQEGYNSGVTLQQSGAYNGSSGSATWSNDPGHGNLILQDATANGSSVSLQQSNYIGADRGNIFNIGQGGSNDHVTATQTANSGAGNAARNDLWIRQGTTAPDLWSWTFGNAFSPAVTPYSLGSLSNSSITVNQNAGGASGSNYAALGQGSGSGDAITVTQSGGDNSADVNQVGGSNTFQSQQYSADGNTGWNFVGGEAGWPDSSVNPLTGTAADFRPILQWGTGNQYYSFQSGTNLWAFSNQIGNYNFLSNTQSGSANKLFTSQTGDSNQIYSTQAGDSNLTTVSQNLNSNYSNTNQNGSNNIATVSQ